MKHFAAAIVLLASCLEQDDTFSADLNDFFGPVLSITPSFTNPGFARLAVSFSPRSNRAPCPVFDDVTAVAGDVELVISSRGSYYEFLEECREATMAADVPMTPGLTVEIEAGQSVTCSLQERHIDSGLELVDQGTWERRSVSQALRVRFGTEVTSPPNFPRIVADAFPLTAPNDKRSIEVTAEADGVYWLHLPALEPRAYLLRLAYADNYGASSRCAFWTGPFATEILTMVAP